MPTVTAASIINRVAKQLQDETNVRWLRPELLDHLNDGQREIVIHKPNAYVRNTTTTLVAGTKQKLPTMDGVTSIDAIQLIDVVRNTNGKAIRLILREILDSQMPDWHSATPASSVVHFCYNELDLKSFYVYPPNNGAGSVEIVYSASPPNVALETNVISVDDIYQAALIDYCTYRAYSKDSEFSADPARAAAHYSAFIATLTGKTQFELATSPNALEKANPNSPRGQ